MLVRRSQVTALYRRNSGRLGKYVAYELGACTRTIFFFEKSSLMCFDRCAGVGPTTMAVSTTPSLGELSAITSRSCFIRSPSRPPLPHGAEPLPCLSAFPHPHLMPMLHDWLSPCRLALKPANK